LLNILRKNSYVKFQENFWKNLVLLPGKSCKTSL
jgi:hypothetical protein